MKICLPLLAMLAAACSPACALDRVLPAPRIKDNGDVRLSDDLAIGRKVGSVLDLSPNSASRRGGVVRNLSDILADSVNVQSFGAKDDDATDNTAAFTAAIAEAMQNRRTLEIGPTEGGKGKYRLSPSTNFQTVNVHTQEGVQLLNLDGTRFNGGHAGVPGARGLVGLINPGFYYSGPRVMAPSGDSIGFTRPGDRAATFMTWSGHTGLPYTVFSSNRDFFIYGQEGPTSGSVANSGRFLQVNNGSNGPGYNLTCTATNGSAVLTACTPSPTGTHTSTLPDGSTLKGGDGADYLIPNVYQPSKITGSGIANGTYAISFDATSITLGARNTYGTPAPYTGATGRITINAQSGRSEFNTGSWHIEVNGTGNKGGMNFYSDDIVTCNESTNPDDQEGGCIGREIITAKQAPGLDLDPLHSGSAGLAVIQIPIQGKKTYTMNDGLVVAGWAGDPGTDGASPGASPGALNGVRIGGGCLSIYCFGSMRSWYKIGLNIQDYETGIAIYNPKPVNTGSAIYIAPGAGNIDLRDNLFVGKHIAGSGPMPTADQGVTLSAAANDNHGMLTVPAGVTGFSVIFAAGYANTPDCVVSSPTNTRTLYAPEPTRIVFAFDALPGTAKFSYHCMGR